MKKFNLKLAKKENISTITEKMVEEQRENMELCNKSQDVVGKNINLSINKKDKDNTIPFNVQLNSARKNEKEFKIIESKMDKKQMSIEDKINQILPINQESQKYDTEKLGKYKKEQQKKETALWDNYVGVQLEGEKTTIDNNIPNSASQLQNHPSRFKKNDIKKMISALKDADAMLFHIYATANKESRDINNNEKQQIIDINSGKNRILESMTQLPLPPQEWGVS